MGIVRHGILQPLPAADAVQADNRQRCQRSDDDKELQHLVVDGSGQAAQGDVGQDDDAGNNERDPHRPAQQSLDDGGQQVQVHACDKQLGYGERNGIDQVRRATEALAHELWHGTHLGAVVERHHHDAQEHHGRDSADPEIVHGLEAILHAVGGHTDDLNRAQVRRNECQAGHPCGQSAAGEEEVDGGGNAGFGSPADSQDEEEVQGNEQVVHPGCVESQY